MTVVATIAHAHGRPTVVWNQRRTCCIAFSSG